MDALLDTLERWRGFSALVVGDFMLDQTHHGDADRLAPDAPVPVLRIRKEESSAGGAANVCANLRALRGSVACVGVVGEDPAAAELRELIASQGIEARGLFADASRPTTVKRSYVGLAQHRHPQKMFRVDHESTDPISREIEDRLLESARSLIDSCDVVCLEDYNKGVCTPRVCAGIVELARASGKPVFVDPARIGSYAKYRGAAAITPNRTEAEDASGLRAGEGPVATSCAALAHALHVQTQAEAVVLTLDRQGALLRTADGSLTHVPTVARQVYDVTGAGDMFLAGLAAGRANGLAWPDAVRLANAAAGLEVEVFGTRPIPLERVHAEVRRLAGRADRKFLSWQEASELARAVQSRGGSVVLTNGCFDVLHAGHVWLLDKAKAEGDILIVATNADETVRRFKGPHRPVNTLEERVRVLCGLASVDAVVVFEQDTPQQLVEHIMPNVLVKGDEYSMAEIPGASAVQARGGRVVRVPMLEGRSSTATLKAMGDPRWRTSTDAQARDRFVRDVPAPDTPMVEGPGGR